MKFAIFILIILGLFSIVGTLIPQNQVPEFYLENYETFGDWIIRLNFDKVYTSWWYGVIALFLCLSLFFCVVVRIKPLIHIINSRGFFSSLEKIGSWILHFGLIFTIFFFVLGNATAFTYSFYNVEDTINEIEGSPYSFYIESFDIELYPDDTVKTYRTVGKVLDKEGNTLDEGEILVNKPMTVDGYQISQLSFGFVVDTKIYKDGNLLGEAPLFKGEYVAAEKGLFSVFMKDLYPDLEIREDGVYNASKKIENPYVDYAVIFGNTIVKEGLEKTDKKIPVGHYEIEFLNPRHYTVMDVRKDSFAKLTAIGALLVVVGSIMAFVPALTKEDYNEF